MRRLPMSMVVGMKSPWVEGGIIARGWGGCIA
jgi:hypothetical protein